MRDENTLAKIISKNMYKINEAHTLLYSEKNNDGKKLQKIFLSKQYTAAMNDHDDEIHKSFSESAVSKYMGHYASRDGQNKPTLEFIYAFARYYEISIDILFSELSEDNILKIATARNNQNSAYKKGASKKTLQIGEKEGFSAILDAITASNPKYASDFNSKTFPFFDWKENKFECRCAHLPLFHKEGVSLQKGEFMFTLTEQGTCLLTIHFEKNSEDLQSVYNGFAVLLNANGPKATLWCFTKLKEKIDGINGSAEKITDVNAEFFMCSFDVSSKKDWNTRMGLALNFNTRYQIPSMFRILLYKGDLREVDFNSYYKGFLSLNAPWIPIHKNTFDKLYDYAGNSEKNRDMDDFFMDIDKKNIKRIIDKYIKPRNGSEEIYRIEPTNPSSESVSYMNPTPKDFETYAILVSWLRTNSVQAMKNEISAESHLDVERVYNAIHARNEKNNNTN
ncbi:MAG: hypothetical protein FWB92_08210 [Oscillospiraceae bacterium]|nr:hypothetical protein [Oscillospiraceae bacterium]